MKHFLFLTCVLFYSFQLYSKSIDPINGVPIITKIPSSIYSAGSQNWSITQGGRGYMYFANNFGLLEFDGKNWNTYKLNQANSNLLCVKAIDKRIYVGGQKEFGYFEADSLNRLQYNSLSEDLPHDIEFDEVWNIYSGKEGEIYFISHDFIFYYDHSRVTAIQTKEATRYSFFIDEFIYSSSAEFGIEKFIPLSQQRILLTNANFLKGKNIRKVLEYSSTKRLIFTLEGEIYKEENNVIAPVAKNLWAELKNAMINTALVLPEKRIAIGTQNAGIYIISDDGEKQDHIVTDQGLTDIIVYDLFIDKQDNLWVAHRNGLSYIELESPFRMLNKFAGIEGGGYTACKDNGKVYLGTSNGLYESHYKGGTFMYHSVKGGRGQSYFVDKINGQVFYGQHLGLYSIQSGESKLVNDKIGAWNLVAIDEEKYLQGAYNGLFILKKTNKGWTREKLKGFHESSRLMSLNKKTNTLWISHGFKGVYRLKIDFTTNEITELKHYGQSDGFYSNVLINLFKINGELVFCGERGIFIYDEENDKFKLHGLYTKLLGTNERVSAMTNDYAGNIYFIQNGKVGMIKNILSNSPIIERNIFGRVNHLVSDDLEQIIPIDKDHVLITAKEGFIDFNPRYQRSFIEKVPLSIISFNSSDGLESHNEYNPQQKKKSIEIPYERNTINVEFVASYYDGMHFNEYETYLQGFDKQPNEWTKSNHVKYTNLKEGNYTLMVKGKNIYGEESTVTSIQFTVLPPWSRSIYAYILYVLLVALLITVLFLASRWSFLNKVKSLLGEKQLQLHNKDIEIQVLKEKQLKQDLEHKNKELALSTVHLTQRNELLSNLKEDLQKILERINKGNFSKVRTYDSLEVIIKKIGKDINDEKEWSRFEEHFNLLHSDFFKILKQQHPALNTQELKICAYIRMNMSSKEMATALNISLRGVETSRYRLRKKLNLDRHENLTDFIENITK
ncbi:triple tyrosine motif-containing protein [Flammeovirga sp. SJP92]|uniref:triple tyrosine motif-containing protein n=1 Tax=Flammeovirga sp. SJP92 TaxID=1775430 RepID=UPI0007878A1C|nr:triple tyrosine motif-containing protein [Flammeovirga sp. SJP92]KXX70392.1 hypothetical protein AVL50_11700 [Flammeovirga sp. SJP92]